MKKPFALIFAMLFLATIVNGQSVKPKSHEATSRVSYTKLKNTYRLESNLGYSRAWHQHSLNLSVIMTLRTDHAETATSSPRFTGAALDYTYHVPCAFSALDVNLTGGTSYRLISNTWSGNYYSAQEEYVPVYTSSLEHFVDFHTGYGFRLWLGSHFFLEHALVGGMYHSKLNAGRNNTKERVDLEGTQHDFRRYGNTGWLLQASLTAGYRF